MSHQIVSISSHVPTQWYYLWNEYLKSLGDNKPMIFQPERWGGLSTKPKVLHWAIKEKIITADHIIFTDCWDLIFCASPEEIMTRYFSFGADVVVSAEANCFPADLQEDFDKLNPPTKYKYLNSGFIVGKTDAIFACLEAMDLSNLPDDHFDGEKNVHPNDQFEWMKVFVKQPVKIKLDYYQALSQTLHGASIDDFDFSGDRIRNKFTNSYPCSWHFNGSSKDEMALREPILKKLNLL